MATPRTWSTYSALTGDADPFHDDVEWVPIRARRRLLAVEDRGAPHVIAEWMGSAQKKKPHGD